MPVDQDPRPRLRSRAPWVAAGVVVAVAGVVGTLTRLHAAPRDTTSVGPSSVVTAPVVTAPLPEPSPGSVDPGTAASGPATGAPGCEDRPAPVLRVLQLNMRAAMTDTGRVDVAGIAEEIEAARPDLVSLNEVDSLTTRTHVDEPAYLGEATGLHVVYGPNLVYDGGPFGNVVLSRFPVLGSRNLRLPVTPGLEPRGLLTVDVSVGGRRVTFASTHLSERDEGRRSRLLQAQAVARALAASDAPVVLAGDLNSVPTDDPARILRSGLLDAQQQGGTGSGNTYPRTRPVARFDYVLYDRRLAVVPGSTRVRASGPSDHRAVFTRLTLLPAGC